ncbi:MAG TPA: nucleoside triphosphate pyrophosphohydrolase [Thermoanaerobaculia bacterium]|nr:nucleoside triphosphate pyrophosphohydrolase [Thermoanaerobaculia bacterium]
MADLGKLLALVARLRAPGGCPWDREQTLADVRGYLLEEAHETAAAIDRVVAAEGAGGDAAAGEPADAWQALAGELGDLLFQAAFVATLAEEAGAFTAAGAIDGVHRKMVERHPHVFPPAGGGGEELPDAAAVARAWERRKLARETPESLLAGVPESLPALLAAYRMTQKAAGVGFDWPEAADVLAKLDEERAELAAALASPAGEAGGGDGDARREAVREEVGDLLFTAANLARKLGVEPEAALAAANAKFRRRFGQVETELARRGRRPDQSDLAEMDALWDKAKRAGR